MSNQAYSEVITKWPDSKYASKAKNGLHHNKKIIQQVNDEITNSIHVQIKGIVSYNDVIELWTIIDNNNKNIYVIAGDKLNAAIKLNNRQVKAKGILGPKSMGFNIDVKPYQCNALYLLSIKKTK